jgi:CheY-like chemotaxis protein
MGAESESKRILVVDDNELNIKLFTKILVREGYQVIPAETAEKCFQLIRNEKPDLVLMDMKLPGMDGLEATRLIKADPATAGIPVVAVSAYAMEEDARRARDAGCDACVTKPIDMKLFVETVHRFAR